MKTSHSKKIIFSDIGATGGVHPRWLPFKNYYYAVLFDADPRANFPNQGIDGLIINKALYKKEENLTINLCKKEEVSSIYEPNFDLIKKYTDPDRFSIVEKTHSYASTLQNEFSINYLDRLDFLKLDTQGSELDILEGSKNLLPSTIGIEVEVEFAQIYVNQPTFFEINQFLERKGFLLFDLRRTYWVFRDPALNSRTMKRSRDKGRMIFGDALYFRDPDSILDNEDGDLCFRASLCFSAYGYDQLAFYILEKAKEKELIHENDYKELSSILNSQMRTNSIIDRLHLKKFLKLILRKLGLRSLAKSIKVRNLDYLGS